jgi:demethylmenaquinone methyltransferase/2-methoxy-6-polyprenyl-1,4-benzoquinol methylase
MKWIYRHPALYDFVDFVFSVSLADRVRRRVLENVNADSFLEIGAGSGKNFAILNSALKIGLDRSSLMLRYAKKRFPHIMAVVGDAHNLPFRDACVSVSVFSYCLRGLSRPMEAVKEAMRVSAEVIIIDYGKPHHVPAAVWERVFNWFGRKIFGSRDIDYDALERLGAERRTIDFHGGLYRVLVLRGG